MKPRIVIADNEVHLEQVIADLESIAEIVRSSDTRAETLANAAREAELMIVSCFTTISATVFENAKRLKAILKFGVGVDNIDLTAATRNGVLVVNCPDYCSDTIAEHAIALIFCLAKRIVPIHTAMREKGWLWPAKELMTIDLIGKTIGLIGFGRIGRAMAAKAGGLGMKIIVYDPYVTPDQVAGLAAEFVSLETLLKTADVVSIHCVLTPETKNLIGARELGMMKKAAYLIDVSRGAIIQEEALLTALREHWIAGAGLDVFAEEPLTSGHPLLGLENVILTPHLAWYTKEAYARLQIENLERVREILAGALPLNLKNPEALEKYSVRWSAVEV